MSILPMTTYRSLLDTVGIPGIMEGTSSLHTEELLHLSKLNKIQLLYSQTTATETDDIGRGYERTLQTIAEVSNIFNNGNINYAVFKTMKPFPSTPSDIDFLLSEEDLRRAKTILSSRGYRSIDKNMFCITMQKEMSLDLYTHPSVANIPYLRRELLMPGKKLTRVSGSDVSILSNEAEFIAVACHSFYKEQLLTLNDFITLTLLAESANLTRIISLAHESAVYDVLSLVLGTCGSVAKNLPVKVKLSALINMIDPATRTVNNMPHRFPLKVVCKMLLEKIMKDEHAMDYFPKAVIASFSLKHAINVMKHLRRETY